MLILCAWKLSIRIVEIDCIYGTNDVGEMIMKSIIQTTLNLMGNKASFNWHGNF